MSHNSGYRMDQQNKFIDSHHTGWFESLLKSSQYHPVINRVINGKEAWKATSYQMTFYNTFQEIMRVKGDVTQPVTSRKTAQCTKCRKTFHQRGCQIHRHGNCHKTWMTREMLICLMSLVSLSWKTSFIINLSFLTGLQHFVQRPGKVHLKHPRSQI